jgi:protein SCO1/2
VTEWDRTRSALSVLAPVGLALGVLAWPPLALAHEAAQEQDEQRLPTLGAAPDFALTSQDGAQVTLKHFRGKVVAVAFIYTSCPDVCPMLTDKMARVQDELGADFGAKVAFLSITVDPERDTPAVLKEYAAAFDANFAGWSFLTGEPAAIRDVAHRYGVAVIEAADGQVDHTLLTTLIDRQGVMRVQYLGYRFDPEEFRHDLQDLVSEP